MDFPKTIAVDNSELVMTPFDFLGKDTFDIAFLVGIEQVLVGSFVSAQVRLGSGELWVSGQA